MNNKSVNLGGILSVGIVILVLALLFNTFGGSKAEKLIGIWVMPMAERNRLEIGTEELRFNYRRFDYEVKGDAIYVNETFPNIGGISGEIPFKLKGDELIIYINDDMSGFFYGHSGGEVVLERR